MYEGVELHGFYLFLKTIVITGKYSKNKRE